MAENKDAIRDLRERFWEKVAIGTDADCWPWGGAKTQNNRGTYYGHFRLGGKMARAHRVAYQIAKGPIPVGLVIRHKCDNPLCCNPAHLETGTQKQNVADRYDRGRAVHRRGSGHPNSKLSAGDVARIRERLAAGETQRAVANDMGISQVGVHYAARKGWRHV